MPNDRCAYVVGDIHGRNDLLLPLLDRIVEDAAHRSKPHTDLIFLGDYVDRGGMSKEVIDTIIDLNLPDINIVTLNGNHEASMLMFMEDPIRNRRWLHYGGEATLRSYGIEFSFGEVEEENIQSAATALSKAVPDRHKKFLNSLVDSYSVGDYFFVHAGVDPSLSLKDQKPRALYWIRDEFLAHEDAYEKIVVHGHSISKTPEFKSNRIGIDTGAFYSNTLTCLVLDGNSKEIL
ncbi:MAG: metallophosphoesterase [Proteobacteria bacterium]|nr:metallophosphoesterase [Pseudomonadota bacterium]